MARSTPEPLRHYVGAKIKEARVAARLSHDRLGERTGHTRQHLIKLEQGRHMPTRETLERIAGALDRDADWFLPPQGEAS